MLFPFVLSLSLCRSYSAQTAAVDDDDEAKKPKVSAEAEGYVWEEVWCPQRSVLPARDGQYSLVFPHSAFFAKV